MLSRNNIDAIEVAFVATAGCSFAKTILSTSRTTVYHYLPYHFCFPVARALSRGFILLDADAN
jgi:hypothetical protein